MRTSVRADGAPPASTITDSLWARERPLITAADICSLRADFGAGDAAPPIAPFEMSGGGGDTTVPEADCEAPAGAAASAVRAEVSSFAPAVDLANSSKRAYSFLSKDRLSEA